ncbi:S9 family peptidase [Vitiosangium sp. GDMCC 1.1324]|uniref:S9 family peptidase n=1 Tax=Vitiosangium sp. (strain GDMCC 1.1324) TaxID=2138576 RepID=UPI000D3598AC|nr:S9 family peptidase [Vitiosangium sp. GDMCC 1.1324]PTL84202.1 S9 family peptidase [Vitiosangium sp. GDMCC 1.1324]
MQLRTTLLRVMAAATLVPALALAAPKTTPAAAVSRPSKQYTVEQFMATTKLNGAAFSPDETRVLFSSNESGIFNAYTLPITGGKAKALTQSKTDSTYAVDYFPKDERILFTRDQGGNEADHLFVRTPDGKEKDLTPGDKLKAMFMAWSRDDSAFYVATNERDARFFDVYRYDAKTYARTLVYQNDSGLSFSDISPDGKWLAFEKPRSTNDADIHLYNVETKEMKHITPHQGEVRFRVSAFDPGSTSLYFLTNQGSEFTRVARYELATGKTEDVESAEWDVMYTYFSRKGGFRITAINEDGRTVVRVHDLKAGKLLELPQLPAGDITSVTISNNEKRMAFYHNGDRSPSNLYIYDFGSKKVSRLTQSLSKDIDAEDLVEAQVVRFKSFDGMEIPNILFKPHQASATAKAPAIVWVHGGPGGQTRKGYSPVIQYLVNHGYVVLGINNRGSSGYGKSFFAADDQKHGREPLLDCVEARKYLASLPYVDAEHIGIAGGSYGGYMTLAALAFHPDAFKAGIDIFGVSNWLRTLKNVPPWWEAQREALYKEMGDPDKQEQMLRDISPLFHAEKISKPLLVLQGANDPRVIKPESDEIVEAVKKNGVPVEYVIFPDEGHGFTKKKNEVEAYSRMLGFLEAHLKATTPAPVN